MKKESQGLKVHLEEYQKKGNGMKKACNGNATVKTWHNGEALLRVVESSEGSKKEVCLAHDYPGADPSPLSRGSQEVLLGIYEAITGDENPVFGDSIEELCKIEEMVGIKPFDIRDVLNSVYDRELLTPSLEEKLTDLYFQLQLADAEYEMGLTIPFDVEDFDANKLIYSNEKV